MAVRLPVIRNGAQSRGRRFGSEARIQRSDLNPDAAALRRWSSTTMTSPIAFTCHRAIHHATNVSFSLRSGKMRGMQRSLCSPSTFPAESSSERRVALAHEHSAHSPRRGRNRKFSGRERLRSGRDTRPTRCKAREQLDSGRGDGARRVLGDARDGAAHGRPT